jgi:hypothetical protein
MLALVAEVADAEVDLAEVGGANGVVVTDSGEVDCRPKFTVSELYSISTLFVRRAQT